METTLYIKEPVSVKPETEQSYFAFMNGGPVGLIPYRDGYWRTTANAIFPKITHWLRPLSISEVPDDENQDELWKEANRLYGKKDHSADGRNLQCESFVIYRRDTFLSNIALLKEDFRKERDFNHVAENHMGNAINQWREENEKLKARVSELEEVQEKLKNPF